MAPLACALVLLSSLARADFDVATDGLRPARTGDSGAPAVTLSVITTMYGRPYARATVALGDSPPQTPDADGTTSFAAAAPASSVLTIRDANAGPLGAPLTRDVSLQKGANRISVAVDAEMVRRAERERQDMDAKALALIDALLKKRPVDADGDSGSGAPTLSADDQKVVDAMDAWLLTKGLNGAFWDKLAKARGLIAQNQALSSPSIIDPTNPNYAQANGDNDPSHGVTFGASFFVTNSACRREVATHEYYHFIFGNANHYYGTQDPEEAIKCPDHLAQLTAQLATGCFSNCTAHPGCVGR